MTREEAIYRLKALLTMCDFRDAFGDRVDDKLYEDAVAMAIEALKFAEWVAKEIFSEDMDDAFAELACRRLEKLGVVKADGNEWVLKVGEEE